MKRCMSEVHRAVMIYTIMCRIGTYVTSCRMTRFLGFVRCLILKTVLGSFDSTRLDTKPKNLVYILIYKVVQI